MIMPWAKVGEAGRRQTRFLGSRGTCYMRWFKRIAISGAILVAIAALGVTALALWVDPNHYKQPIADAVKNRYDRTLRIDGKLKLSFFPSLGVEMEHFSLSEPRSAQIFAAADSARASVAVLPLLAGRIVVDHIKVTGLKANVVRYQNGKFNFDDLLGETTDDAGPAAKGQLQAEEAKPLEFDVAGIEFTGGELALRDYVRGTSMRVERLAATTGRVAPRRPFEFSVSARVLGQTPRVDASVQSQGRLTFDPAAKRVSVKGLDFKAMGVLPSIRATALTARGEIAYDGLRESIDASGVSVSFQGDVAGTRPLTGVDARLEVPRLMAGLSEGQLQVEKLSLSSQGKFGPDAFELSLSAPTLNVSPDQARGEAVTARLRMSGERTVDARLELSGVSGNADKLGMSRVAVDGEIRDGERVIKLSAASPLEASLRRKAASLTEAEGRVDISDPALPAGPMQIPFTGRVRADLEKELVSARIDATLEGGQFRATTEVAEFDEPRVTFSLSADTLDLDKLVPARKADATRRSGSTGAGQVSADQPVDLSMLEGVTANGTIKIGSLVVRGLKASNVSASVRVAKGRADVSGLKASLYGGTLSGSLFADAASHRIGFAPTLANVSLGPLLSDVAQEGRLSGRGTVAVNVTATGKSVEAMKRGLNGTVNLSLRDGAIKGVNIAQSLREFRSLLSQRKDDTQQHHGALQTDFSEMQARVVFAGGIGTVRDLSVKAPLLRVAAGEPAKLDVPAQRVDLVALVTVVNTSTGQDGKDLAELHNVTVPLHISGPFDAPSYTIQWSQVAGSVLKNFLQETIQEGLGKAEPVDRLRDRLKGIFK